MNIPKSIKHILWMDFADKYSFYGMKAILPVFLLNIIFFTEAKTVITMQIFLSITYLAMIITTYIAGKFVSYKNLLILSAFISFVGHYFLSCSNTQLNVYAGIIIISMCSGIIQICMPAMVIQQCKNDKNIITKSMSLIYLFTNIGTISILITPWIYYKYGYKLAFLSPTIATFFAGSILLFGNKHYVSEPVKKISTVKSGVVIKKLIFAMVVISVFYVFMSQIYSSWIIQANKMNGSILGFNILPSQMQFLDTILVVTLLPLILFKFIPFLQSRNLFKTEFSQINCGLLMSILSFTSITIIQYHIEKGVALNLAWQIIPYIFIAIAEILVRTVGLNLLFSSVSSEESVFVGLIFAIINLCVNTIFIFIFKQFSLINLDFFIFCTIILFVMAVVSFVLITKEKKYFFGSVKDF